MNRPQPHNVRLMNRDGRRPAVVADATRVVLHTADECRRFGKTLIELLAVISVMAVVLSSGLRVLHILFRAERTGTQQVAETAAFSQLARGFRRDVHAAMESRIVAEADGGVGLELTLAGGRRVLYSPTDGVLLKTAFHGAGEPVARQQFRLPRRLLRFEPAEEDGGVLLVCEPSTGDVTTPGGRPTLPLRVLAIVGRDRRFTGDQP